MLIFLSRSVLNSYRRAARARLPVVSRVVWARRDADEEGHIDKEQFAKAIQGVGLHVSKRYAKILYDHCDADRSGELEVDELRTTLDEMRGRLVQTRRLRAVGLKWVACAESPTTRSPKYGRDLTDDYLYRGLHDMLRGGKLELTFKQLDEFNLRNLHTNHIITVDEAHFCPQVVFGLEWLPVSTRPAHGEELTAEVFTKGPTARDMKRSATRRLSEANALLTGGSRRNSSHKALPVDNLRPGTRGLLVRSTTSVFARSRKESLRTNLERKVTSFEYEDLVQMGIQPGERKSASLTRASLLPCLPPSNLPPPPPFPTQACCAPTTTSRPTSTASRPSTSRAARWGCAGSRSNQWGRSCT